MERTILHCDLNGFYASVECSLRPELATVPMAVCGNPENRHGIILAKNELAKGYGVQTAETIFQARRKCPQLVLVAPHRDEYRRVSIAANHIFHRFSDLVEPFGIDESWIDVTHSPHRLGDGKAIADTLRETIKRELHLTASVGVSYNKVLAKLGSDYRKPDATTVIQRNDLTTIVHPLPVTDLLYVGKAAYSELAKLGIHTIGDLAHADPSILRERLGKLGETIHQYANGIDFSPVAPYHEEREAKSIGNGITFRRNLHSNDDIHAALSTLADSVASRLRKGGYQCRTVHIAVKDPDFRTITRQEPLPCPSDLSVDLCKACVNMIGSIWDGQAPIRAITVTATNLVRGGMDEQLSLLEEPRPLHAKREKLAKAMDAIRNRYGYGAITPASSLDSDLLEASEED